MNKTKSKRVLLDDGFDQPQDVTGLDMAFGGNISALMPKYETVPDKFKRHSGPWVDFTSDWFFKGTSKNAVINRDDVDPEKAWRHLAAIQVSWEPKHEHKTAAVAWLASRWFAGLAK